MSRRLIILAGVTLVAVIVAGVVAGSSFSGASFTTSSDTWANASTDRTSSWVHLVSRATDPDTGDRAGYANQYGVSPATACATGQDEGIAITLGRFPTWTSGTYAFTRVIALKTPTAFVDPTVTRVTATLTVQADSDNGRQPLQNVGLAPIGSTGTAGSVVLRANQKVQLNLEVATTWWWVIFYGSTYRPRIRIELAFPGAPDDYYVYEYPVLITVG
jgi:hypothetical protein